MIRLKHIKILICYWCLMLLIGLTLNINPAYGQNNLGFMRLTKGDGLSNNSIRYIYRDRMGFVWFATESGLNRYDGIRFKVFKHNALNPKSIPYNRVDHITEDCFNNLWIKLGDYGYAVYDSRKENFIYPITDYLSTLGLSNIKPELVFCNSDSLIWLSEHNGSLHCGNPKTKTWNTFNGIAEGFVTDISKNGKKVYVVYSSGMLVVFNVDNLTIDKKIDLSVEFNLPQTGNSLQVFADSRGGLWFYQQKTPDGIMVYNTQTNASYVLKTSKGNSPYLLTGNMINDIAEDPRNRIWIAIDHGGINIIDLDEQKIIKADYQPENPRTLPEKSIYCLHRDFENIIWVGSYKSGVAYHSPSLFKFNVLRPEKDNVSGEFDNDIDAIEQDNNGNTWLGSNNKGLMKLSPDGTKQVYNSQKRGTIPGNVVVALKNDSRNCLWIGTYHNGLCKYEKGRFTNYPISDEKNGKTLTCGNVWSIDEAYGGKIWIGTLGGGINILNPETNTFKYITEENGLISNYVTCVKSISGEKILIGSAYGLQVFNTQSYESETLMSDSINPSGLVEKSITCAFEDSRKLIWAGTREGVVVINPRTGIHTLLNSTSNLCDDVINGILEDDHKNIWISTANGLTQIIVGVDPRDGSFTYIPVCYDENDGLQSSVFNERSALKTSNGRLIFGGINGCNIVDVDSIKYNNFTPCVVFTGLRVNNSVVAIDSMYNNCVILPQSMCFTDTVKLSYKENIFTIEFSALNFQQSEKTKYYYTLEGFSDTQTEVQGVNASVTYTNLNPGKYVFKVLSVNNDGYKARQAAELTIIITPPFYKTTFAYCFYGLMLLLIIVGGIYAAYKIMHTKIIVEQERLNAENGRKVDDMKFRFFTNVSHEFRTQITLIIVPLQKLLKNVSGSDNKKTLALVEKNAQKLLLYTDQILDLRKIDINEQKIELKKLNVVETINKTCYRFADMYEKKKIRFTFSSCADDIQMVCDEEKVEKIVSNLLSNACKYTSTDGSIETTINIVENEKLSKKMLEVSISDTGKGVNPENRSLVFDRFFQEDNDVSNITGSGLGLYISKQFVEMLGGEISYRPNNPQGSVFVFSLPMDLKSDEENTVSENAVELHTINPEVETANVEYDISPSKSGGAEKKCVLIIDDNEDFRTFLADSLSLYFNILQTSDPKEGLKIAADKLPDLIISDIMMPGISGFKVCKILKSDAKTSHIPIILLTARNSNDDVVKGLENGADEYIVKPFNLEILLLKINKFIETKKSSSQLPIITSEINVPSLDEKLINKAVASVEKNIENPDFSVEAFAKDLGMSRVHLYKKLLSLTGKSPTEFIRTVRIKRAAQLLEKSQYSVSEIAYMVGFNNPKYFSKHFKEEYGMLPSDYAKLHKK